MELKDFIRQTLEQIVEGVSSARSHVEDRGGTINPTSITFRRDGEWNNFNSGMPQNVEFDVGLTSVDKKGATEGIGVFLGSVSLGKKNESGLEHTAVTRVRFSVPLVFPKGKDLREKEA